MQNPALLSILCRVTDAPGLSCLRLQGGSPLLSLFRLLKGATLQGTRMPGNSVWKIGVDVAPW